MEKTTVGEPELNDFLDKEFSERFRAFNEGIKKTIEEIRFSLDGLKEQVRLISEKEAVVEEGNARLRQAVRTSKTELSNKFNALIESLKPPEAIGLKEDFTGLKQYAAESLNELNKSVSWFRKNIAYTGIIFKVEIKELGIRTNALNKAFIELNKACNNPELTAFHQLRQEMVSLNEARHELERDRKLLAEKEALLKSIKTSLAGKQDALAELKSSNEFIELNALQARQDDLNKLVTSKADEARIAFSSVGRQLEKFNKLVQSNNYVIEKHKESLLNDYASDFLKACRNDAGLHGLDVLVKETINALKEGKLHLKKQEFNKKLAALKGFNPGKLNNTVNELKAVEKELDELNQKISKSTVNKRTDDLGRESNSLADEAKIAENQLNALRESIISSEKKQALKRQGIEQKLRKLLSKEITIS